MKQSYFRNLSNMLIVVHLLFCALNYHVHCSRIHKENSLIKKNLDILNEIKEEGIVEEISKIKKELVQNIKEGKINFSKNNC
jgi:hypothetical protein